MNQIFIGVVIGVVTAALVRWLGIDRSKTVVTIHHATKVSRKWKLLIVISWIMMPAGIYLLIIGLPEGGLSNSNAVLGTYLFSIGITFELFGKFMCWWNRSW